MIQFQLVQSISAGQVTPGNASATSVSVTFPNPVMIGSLVVAGVGAIGAAVPAWSLTDDKSNTYINPKGSVDLQSNGYVNSALYLTNIRNNPKTLTLTVDNVTNYTFWRLYAAEFNPGQGAVANLDQLVSQHENPNNTTTANAPTLTPTSNNELVWVYLSDSQFATKTAGSGFTLINSQAGDFIGAEYQVQTTSTAIAATMNRGASGNDDWMYALSFVATYPWVSFPE